LNQRIINSGYGLRLKRDSKEISGVYIGRRDNVGAKGLWQSLPPVYRQCAVCYTNLWAAYNEILPTKRYRAVEKESEQNKPY